MRRSTRGSRTSSAVPTPITRLTSCRSSPSGSRPLAASDSRRSDLSAFCPGGGGSRRNLGLLRRTMEPRTGRSVHRCPVEPLRLAVQQPSAVETSSGHHRGALYSYPQQSHVIYFRAQGDPPGLIEIVGVLHGRMEPARHV